MKKILKKLQEIPDGQRLKYSQQLIEYIEKVSASPINTKNKLYNLADAGVGPYDFLEVLNELIEKGKVGKN